MNVKRYFKVDYKLYVSKDERCVDYCIVYVLSLFIDFLFKVDCDYVYNVVCDVCSGLEVVVEEIRVKIEDGFGVGFDDEVKRKFYFDYDKVKEVIGVWKVYNICVVN